MDCDMDNGAVNGADRRGMVSSHPRFGRAWMSLNPLAAAAAALLALAGAQSAAAQARAPATQHFRLGAFELTALHDADFSPPNDGKIFGLNAGAPAVAQLLAEAGAPTDSIAMSVDALLVKTPGHLVLLDTGLGPAGHGVLMASLAQAGVTPAEVTDILITHSHGDHVGGLVDADGKPAIPKATIRMSAKEWAWMQSQPRSKDLALSISPQVKTFEPGKPVLPGITPIAIDGHTPGHVGYEIVSQGRRLTDIGDTAHSAIVSLERPDWTVGFDNDKAVGVANRRATLMRVASGHELVFAPHFPFPGIGRIEAAKDGFSWKPGFDPAK
jgi:glyoxylase-like metal-dependent hydrolase (beta-lactamase superfamily II)